MSTVTSIHAGQLIPGDRLHWQHDAVDLIEVVIDARPNHDTIDVKGTIIRTAEHVRLRLGRDDWVTVTRREDQ